MSLVDIHGPLRVPGFLVASTPTILQPHDNQVATVTGEQCRQHCVHSFAG